MLRYHRLEVIPRVGQYPRAPHHGLHWRDLQEDGREEQVNELPSIQHVGEAAGRTCCHAWNLLGRLLHSIHPAYCATCCQCPGRNCGRADLQWRRSNYVESTPRWASKALPAKF